MERQFNPKFLRRVLDLKYAGMHAAAVNHQRRKEAVGLRKSDHVRLLDQTYGRLIGFVPPGESLLNCLHLALMVKTEKVWRLGKEERADRPRWIIATELNPGKWLIRCLDEEGIQKVIPAQVEIVNSPPRSWAQHPEEKIRQRQERQKKGDAV